MVAGCYADLGLARLHVSRLDASYRYQLSHFTYLRDGFLHDWHQGFVLHLSNMAEHLNKSKYNGQVR